MSSTNYSLDINSLSLSKNLTNYSNSYRKYFNTENSFLHYSPKTLTTLDSISPFDINYVERNKYLASMKQKPDFNSLLLSAKNISNFNNNNEFKTNDEKLNEHLNEKYKNRIKIRKNADLIVKKLLKEIYEKNNENNEKNEKNNEKNEKNNENNEKNNENNENEKNDENNLINNENKIDMNEFTKKENLFYSFRISNTPSKQFSSYSTQIKCFGDLNNRNNFLIGSNFLLDNFKYKKLNFKNEENKKINFNIKNPIEFKFSLDKERKNKFYENYTTKMDKKKIKINNFNNLNINEIIKNSNELVKDLQKQIKITKQDYLIKKNTIKKFQDDILFLK